MTHMFQGTLKKMRTELQGEVQYYLPIGDKDVHLNEYIGGQITIKFGGEIFCLHCGKKTNKSYSGGYCFPHSQSLPECDICIMRPELCHYHKGTCRDSEWGENHCLKPHYVYLANSSGLKVGITRETQIPTRWIDQGASFAVPFFKVQTRLQSGLVERLVGSYVADKTNWRKMLKNEVNKIDLKAEKKRLYDLVKDEIDRLNREQDGAFEYLDDVDVVTIEYPVLKYPDKIKSFDLMKSSEVSGKLLGIKGQYLILDSGVINIRKHAAFSVEVALEEKREEDHGGTQESLFEGL